MTSRRSFVKQSGLALAAMAFMPSCVISKPRTKHLGVQLYSLRDHVNNNPKGVLEKVAKIGFKQVETYGLEKGKFWGMSVSELKSVLDDNDLKSPSGHYNADPFLSKKGTDADFSHILDVAKNLNQEYVTIPHLAERLRTSGDDYRRVAERLNRAGELCKSAGLKLGYHNHAFEFEKYGNESGYDIFLNNTDADLVDFEMDIYWVVRAGKDPVELFNKHSNRFTMWHVKDADKTNPKVNTEVGSGSINFKSIFDARKAAGAKYYFVEQESFKMDAFQSLQKSFDFVTSRLL